MKKIQSVKIVRLVDDSPDLSYLGEYSNNRDSSDGKSFDRAELGDYSRGEFSFFTAAMSGDETGNPDSPRQDYERMESYNRGDWHMCGVRAEAEIIVDGIIQEITSAGLWGIESDSEESYFEEIGNEELQQLADILEELGFTRSAIHKAITQAEKVTA